ncbi:MAG: enoyl-CoA hydratase/isomerase family protein [Deltaproteobacteria bacterium]|nr:MAG: enoyl-CoA hydratase/isomerase family protein [Deltaproteobacteria bacterium]
MIRVESTDGIALVRFERPPANAIELESATALEETLARLEADPATQAVVLTGHAEFFSAGLDLKVVPTYGPEQQRAMVMAINRLIGRLYGLGIPAVAAVNGHAIAGGVVVVLACDFRIGRRGPYRLGLTETRAAVPYPVAAMTVVTTELSPAVARRAVPLARNGTPENALADGILDELETGDAVLSRALAVARELAALPRSAYASIKRQLRAPALERIGNVLATGSDPLVVGWLAPETSSAAAGLLGRAS